MIDPAAVTAIVTAGQRMNAHGWVPATAGNISLRGSDGRIVITRSGGHKGFLTADWLMEVDLQGNALTEAARPSAETLLHCQLYRRFSTVGAVLHGHSVAGTVLSMTTSDPTIRFEGYELLKAFEGQRTHAITLDLKLFDNDQDISRLAALVEPHLGNCPMGYLIRGHGVYMWGPDMDTALARLEGLEFLLSCELERRKLSHEPSDHLRR